MATHPMGPRLLKGAIVGFDLFDPVASVIVFQYNPETLTRTVKPRGVGEGGGGGKSEPSRVTGPPEESIKIDVEIDATDQLERGHGLTRDLGIFPQLSALEMLVYPKLAQVLPNTALLAAGVIEVMPPVLSFTLFVWGYKRVVPVRVTEFTITEEAHDTALNPIRAKVSLGLQVLGYNDLSLTHPGYWIYMAHHDLKEALAAIGSVGDVAAVAGGDVKLF